MSYREPHAAAEPHQGAVMGMRGCEAASECSSERPGHGLHRMQHQLAAVTASKWIDAIVLAHDPGGFVTLAEFTSGDITRVWHHESLGDVLSAGDPVALHAVYGVLAAGERQLSVALA